MSRKYLRLMAVVLVVVMLAVVAAGCGSNKITDDKQSTQSTSTVVEPVKEELKEVTLRFYFPGDKKPATDDVWNAIGDTFKDQLNAKFQINYVGWSDFPTKMTIIAASGDNYDMNFDANWTGLYPKMLNANAYLTLNDLLPKYAPKLYDMVSSSGALKACTVSGNVVSIPWTLTQNQARRYVNWRLDIADKYGLSYSKDSIKTVEEFDKFLYDARKVLPKDIDVIKWNNNNYSDILSILLNKYELVKLDFHGLVFDLNDPACKLIPIEQTQAYKESVDLVKKWANDGIISKNMMVDKSDLNADFRSGKLLANFSTHEWANANWGFSDATAKTQVSELYSDKKSYNRSSLSNAVALNKNAANPERTLMFLEMVQTNKDLYDMVMYGIKDKTYVLDGDKAAYPQGITAQNSNYMDWHGQWAMWSPEFMRPTDTYPAGFWKGEAEFAKSTNNFANKIDGLLLNTDNIKNEIAKRDQLETDTGKILQYGAANNKDAALSDYIEKQKAAGLDKILADLQKQVDDYLASNK